MMTASFEFWHKYVSESNYYCSTVLPPISAVCEHKNPEKLSKRPFLRHFTSFYGSVWTILFRMCSITFFDFYTIYVIGLGQKICTLTKFPKQPRVNIHKSQCFDSSNVVLALDAIRGVFEPKFLGQQAKTVSQRILCLNDFSITNHATNITYQ